MCIMFLFYREMAMIRKMYFVCFLLLTSVTLSAISEIRTIHHLEEIPATEFLKNTLVMFDLDDVLVYPQDALLQNWRSGWKPEGMSEWTAEEDTIAWMNATFQLMDSFGPELINRLNERGVPAIGFTSFAMDQSTMIKSIPNWRHTHLMELGLHFKMEEDVVFSSQEGFIPPSFEKGVLYCGNVYKKEKDNKGKVLSLYLDWLNWQPEQVVLVDDSEQNINSVKKELERRGISFLGFLYIPKELDPIDEEVATLQYETIINHKKWLSDDEAKQILADSLTISSK